MAAECCQKKQMDPEQGWVPKEFGRSPQKDDPSWGSGTTHNKGDSGILRIPEESHCYWQEDDPLCRVVSLRRHQPKKECSKGTRSQDFEELLHLRKGSKTAKNIGGRSRWQQPRLETMRNSNKVFGKTIGLEFGKKAARSSVALWKPRTGHCGGVDPLRSVRRGHTRSKSPKCGSTDYSG
jgi:hypothetical protein